MPSDRIRKIRLSNGILLTGEIILVLLSIKSLFNNLVSEFLVQFLGMVLFAIPLICNYLGHNKAAKLLCVLITIFYLSFLTIFWGSDRGSQLIIFAVTGLAVLFFENKKVIVSLCIIAALAIILVEVYGFYYEPFYYPPNIKQAYLINILITIILIGVVTGIFKREIYKYQAQITSVNNEIISQNRNMAELNKSLSASVNVIKEQKAAIDEAHKRLRDSINYAKTIQQALLFIPAEVKKFIPDYFVLFQPLHIVSGDFYYFHVREKLIFIAAVDCTGHGVPGAFMSMIGHRVLQEAIETEKINEPDRILNFLNEKVNMILKQSYTSNNDGMDVSMITINIEDREICYAGAKNSLLIATGKTIKKIKGDRFSIGGFTPLDHEYSVNRLQLKKNDCIYLMSDGFQDQFGGPDNKRFMSNRLSELINLIHQENMQVQYEKLSASLKAWSENNEQTDDILLIGLRI